MGNFYSGIIDCRLPGSYAWLVCFMCFLRFACVSKYLTQTKAKRHLASTKQLEIPITVVGCVPVADFVYISVLKLA